MEITAIKVDLLQGEAVTYTKEEGIWYVRDTDTHSTPAHIRCKHFNNKGAIIEYFFFGDTHTKFVPKKNLTFA